MVHVSHNIYHAIATLNELALAAIMVERVFFEFEKLRASHKAREDGKRTVKRNSAKVSLDDNHNLSEEEKQKMLDSIEPLDGNRVKEFLLKYSYLFLWLIPIWSISSLCFMSFEYFELTENVFYSCQIGQLLLSLACFFLVIFYLTEYAMLEKATKETQFSESAELNLAQGSLTILLNELKK